MCMLIEYREYRAWVAQYPIMTPDLIFGYKEFLEMYERQNIPEGCYRD